METSQPHRTQLRVWGAFNWITVDNVTGTQQWKQTEPSGVSVWEGWQVTWMAINMGWMSARDFGRGEIPAEGSRGDQGEEITRRPSGISVTQIFRFCTVGTGEWLASSAYRLKFIYFTIHSQYFPFFITKKTTTIDFVVLAEFVDYSVTRSSKNM